MPIEGRRSKPSVIAASQARQALLLRLDDRRLNHVADTGFALVQLFLDDVLH
jgi:hypothetical protein